MKQLDIHSLDENFDKKSFISQQDLSKGIEFSYFSQFQNAKILRDFIEVIAEKLNLDKGFIAKFILIADEMNNNAIEYGSKEDERNFLRIKTEQKWDKTEIRLEVEDTGNGKKHKPSLEMETLRAHQLKLWYSEHSSIRGRWLFMIIVKLVDRLYFKDSPTWGLIVGIKKKI